MFLKPTKARGTSLVMHSIVTTMLKITETDRTDYSVTLKLEGHVAEECLSTITAACDEVLASGCRLELDMADVSFVERHAVPYFITLRSEHVALVNCSPFLREQIGKGVAFYANTNK